MPRATEPRKSVRGFQHSICRWYAKATPAEHLHGVQWYNLERGRIADLAARYGVTVDVAAGVTAVLSPMVRWEQNLVEMEYVLLRAAGGVRFGDAGYRKGHVAFSANIRKAYDIVERGFSAGVVSGRKVTAFYRLLAGPCDAVVLDSIAIMAAVGIDPTPFVSSADAKAYFGRPVALNLIERAYRRAAVALKLRPDQLQAVVWTVWRNERDKS